MDRYIRDLVRGKEEVDEDEEERRRTPNAFLSIYSKIYNEIEKTLSEAQCLLYST